MNTEDSKKVRLSIPFASSETALLACDVLSVDQELNRSGVTKKMITEGANLVVNFHGAELKKLRVAVNAFLKNVTLVVKTLDQFQHC